MLSNAQEKLIRSLQTKKGREKSGKCLVEGQKVIDVAGNFVEFVFHQNDTVDFYDLVTTQAPQKIAAVARVPEWTREQVLDRKTVIVLDGVQDPGNVGAILRLCLGFDASLVLIESVDVTNPKVVRSSVGALFQVPWMTIPRPEASDWLRATSRPVYRLERSEVGLTVSSLARPEPVILLAGSEGNGIQLPLEGVSVEISHDPRLESLNVGHAVAIALYARA